MGGTVQGDCGELRGGIRLRRRLRAVGVANMPLEVGHCAYRSPSTSLRAASALRLRTFVMRTAVIVKRTPPTRNSTSVMMPPDTHANQVSLSGGTGSLTLYLPLLRARCADASGLENPGFKFKPASMGSGARTCERATTSGRTAGVRTQSGVLLLGWPHLVPRVPSEDGELVLVAS